jgi:hypothetical protein
MNQKEEEGRKERRKFTDVNGSNIIITHTHLPTTTHIYAYKTQQHHQQQPPPPHQFVFSNKNST